MFTCKRRLSRANVLFLVLYLLVADVAALWRRRNSKNMQRNSTHLVVEDQCASASDLTASHQVKNNKGGRSKCRWYHGYEHLIIKLIIGVLAAAVGAAASSFASEGEPKKKVCIEKGGNEEFAYCVCYLVVEVACAYTIVMFIPIREIEDRHLYRQFRLRQEAIAWNGLGI